MRCGASRAPAEARSSLREGAAAPGGHEPALETTLESSLEGGRAVIMTTNLMESL